MDRGNCKNSVNRDKILRIIMNENNGNPMRITPIFRGQKPKFGGSGFVNWSRLLVPVGIQSWNPNANAISISNPNPLESKKS